MKEAFWIIDQLIAQGIDHFCIAPGSRSTPLVIAAAEHPRAKLIVHYDERGLGFYALGVGKGRKRPAAVITTSGSAVGNLFPSVMEACHSHTPLILLTADRPPELRDCGAIQACDQIKLFSNYLRWQTDLPPELNESYFRSIAAQAVFHAECNLPGPVQLNCQFREPLYNPTSLMSSGSALLFPSTQTIPEPLHTQASRGLILVGSLPSSPLPILELAKRLNWPVFADILSNARNFSTSEQIRHFDWILKTGAELSPDFVLHFGERLTSKKALDLPVSLHVSPYSDLQDPTRSLSSRITCDIASFCKRFSADPTDPDWLPLWQKKDREIDSTIEGFFTSTRPFTEAHAIRYLSKIVPETHAIFLGNSMPIRDSDHFLFPEKCFNVL